MARPCVLRIKNEPETARQRGTHFLLDAIILVLSLATVGLMTLDLVISLR